MTTLTKHRPKALANDAPAIPKPGPSGVRGKVVEFLAMIRWLIRGLLDAIGVLRILFVAVEAFIGSLAVSAMGFAIIFVVRTMTGEDGATLRGIPTPDLPAWLLLVIILVGGTIGSICFYDSERRASKAALKLGDELRGSLLESLSKPNSRGWQTSLGRDTNRTVSKVAISAVREISVAAREIFQMVGPTGMILGTLTLLIVLEPLITGLLLPFGALFLIPTYLINRNVDQLNRDFEDSQQSTVAELRNSIDDLINTGASSGTDATVGLARRSDELIHDRLLAPIRMRAIGVIATAYFSAFVLGVFVLRAGDDIDFLRVIIYLICLRLFASGVQRISRSTVSITRRALAVEQYRGFEQQLAVYQQNRASRLDSEEIPAILEIEDSEGWVIELSRGSTAIVITERAPTRSDADQFLVGLERSMEKNGEVFDLVTNSMVSSAAKDINSETHIVGATKEDAPTIAVLIDADVSNAATSLSNQITFVLTARANKSWDSALDEWSHLIDGVIVLRGSDIEFVCTLEWAKDNRAELLEALGRD